MSALWLYIAFARLTWFGAFPAFGEFRLNSPMDPPRESPLALRLSSRECS
jgi:hypothetical protein